MLLKDCFLSLDKHYWNNIDQLQGVNDRFEVVINHLPEVINQFGKVIDQLVIVIVTSGPLTYRIGEIGLPFLVAI